MSIATSKTPTKSTEFVHQSTVCVCSYVETGKRRYVFANIAENLVENLLKPLILAFRRRNIPLQEIPVGVHLETDQVRNFENVPELSKINPFCHTLVRVLKVDKKIFKNFSTGIKPGRTAELKSPEKSIVKRQRIRPADKKPHRQFGKLEKKSNFFWNFSDRKARTKNHISSPAG